MTTRSGAGLQRATRHAPVPSGPSIGPRALRRRLRRLVGQEARGRQTRLTRGRGAPMSRGRLCRRRADGSRACGVGRAGGCAAEPDRCTRRANARVITSGCQPRPSGIVKTKPVSVHAGPACRRSSSGCERCARSTFTVTPSRSMTRRERVDFTSPSLCSWSTVVIVWRTTRRALSRSRSCQRRPQSSARRRPVIAARRSSGA